LTTPVSLGSDENQRYVPYDRSGVLVRKGRAMHDVVEELSGESGELSKERVERRVADWKQRISSLYRDLEEWLPEGFSAESDDSVGMNEELMKKYAVESTKLPILKIYRGESSIASLTPRGLWIIGANGRLDLFIQSNQWIVVDKAEIFESPDWQIAPANERRALRPLNAEAWANALGV
jgi:hypothetical protein